MNDLKGKVILITGAGKGAGCSLAEALAEHGAFVAANDISPINVDEVVSKINARSGKAKTYIEDVAKKVGVQALVKAVEDDLGGIDILINHAEVEPLASLLDMDEWDWRRALEVNLTGAFLMLQSVGRMMRAKGRGTIMNIIAGTGGGPDAHREAGAYIASKAGLAALSYQADMEFSPYGIRVYVVENSEGVVNNVLSLLEVK
jgi:NAD(P)-dependent dehydrogenase (short-subunit alcohol dehydrogenase family)